MKTLEGVVTRRAKFRNGNLIPQECEHEISQKGELVAKLEAKTKEISQMLTNLNKVTSQEQR